MNNLKITRNRIFGQSLVVMAFRVTVKSSCGWARRTNALQLFSPANPVAPARPLFAGNFKGYADRVNDLPVDWHELIALMAPRPVYIAVAEQDYWGDPHGSFIAAKAAEPVYQLFGEKGLGVDEMPPVETPVGDFIGFHERKGTHGQDNYDWEQFLNFADQHFGIAEISK